jgi:hypothetical protein
VSPNKFGIHLTTIEGAILVLRQQWKIFYSEYFKSINWLWPFLF